MQRLAREHERHHAPRHGIGRARLLHRAREEEEALAGGEGHELASHGWDHARGFRLDATSFAADLDRSRKTIEDASGEAVTGYRAPSFSIDARTPWAHKVLAEQGYAYSSSVAPIRATSV